MHMIKTCQTQIVCCWSACAENRFLTEKRKGGKLDSRYLGPFEIKRRLGNGVFELADCNGGEECICVTGAHLSCKLQLILFSLIMFLHA